MLAEPNPRACRRLLHLCVSVCMYVYVCVCTYLCSCCTVMFMRVCVCVCVCVCVRAFVRACVRVSDVQSCV